ncbi:exosortase/archaeosortase family protein [Mucilaginibacter aquariorum]|uniref:Exosortase/archaeosortase family protein n=1 Tax=Mucilaginibacter aquariorum TaxID=2967225 RepID=A0ABT1SW42_9SPHI|nr:exosortase/archaeosortase family protein [Mucilaginibacter aquariorum]MCQ6956482.1 exosortase/archaeosortase family protein [Mucilaginibacter aquariorum]
MFSTAKYFDIAWFIKFILIVLVLYYFSIAYNGIVSPEGRFYSPFLNHYLNYISWIRVSILYVSKFIALAFGTHSYIANAQLIKLTNGTEVEIWLPCLGLGITSCWIAFVVTHKVAWQKKILWCIAGSLAIWFINCCRIALLLVALNNNWKESGAIDHHDIFNAIAYTFIFILMYLYSNYYKKRLIIAGWGISTPK